MAVTNIKLVPVCVDVGEAIFICIDYNYGGTVTKHCYLVDGGGGDENSLVQESTREAEEQHKGVTNLANPVTHSPAIYDHLKLATTYRQLSTTEGFALKGIIMTHPDEDHYQGIKYLLQTYHEINCPVLMTNRFLKERLRQQGVCDFLQVLEITHIGKHTVRQDQEHELMRLGFPKFFEFWHSEIGLVIYTLRDQYFPRQVTERALDMPQGGEPLTPVDDNITSIVTTIRNPDNSDEVLACLTGDAVLRNDAYFRGKHPLIVFQVHIGNEDSSGVDMYNQIADNECIYLISCGTKFGGSSDTALRQVLQDVCTANQNKGRIRIILTSNSYLGNTLMESIQNPQVLIYYWDKHVHAHQPYLNIPLSDPIDLALMPNLVAWTIEGYTTMINRSPNKKICRFYLSTPTKKSSRYWKLKDRIEPDQFPLTKNKDFLHGIYNIPPPWSPPSLWNSIGNIIVLTNAHYEILRGPLILSHSAELNDNTYEIFKCDQVTWRSLRVLNEDGGHDKYYITRS